MDYPEGGDQDWPAGTPQAMPQAAQETLGTRAWVEATLAWLDA